jgi:hypothetical protein
MNPPTDEATHSNPFFRVVDKELQVTVGGKGRDIENEKWQPSERVLLKIDSAINFLMVVRKW